MKAISVFYICMTTIMTYSLCAVLPCHAQDDAGIIRHEIEIQQQRLKSIEQDIKRHKRRVIKVEKSKIEVLTELQKLDQNIADAWERLEEVKKQWSAAELELEIIKQELEKKQKDAEKLKVYIENRLIALRQMGMVGALNVLFEAESLPDFMAREQYLKLVIKHDREKRLEYIKIIKELEKKRAELEKKNKALARLSDEVERQALLLEDRKAEKSAFLKELTQKGKKYAAMIKELRRAKKALQSVIDELNQNLELQQGPTEEELGSFAAQKGELNPPVLGPVMPVYAANGKRVRGITISCPWGTEIRAIFDGRVIYCNALKGFGQVIIIDHGDGYMSLTAQGASYFKKTGDEVVEGDVIGISGGGPWVREGIYFELRHGKKQENPLIWFDPKVIRRAQ